MYNAWYFVSAEACALPTELKMTELIENFLSQMVTNIPMDTEMDVDMFIFDLTFRVSVRQFKGQSSAPYARSIRAYGNSVQEFLQNVWNNISGDVHREVIVGDDGVSWQWSQTTIPTFPDMKNFCLFKDLTAKRVTTIEKIRSETLQGWVPNDELVLFVHIYGNVVSSSNIFKSVRDTLLTPTQTDRAGASAVSVTQEIKQRLKDFHSSHYQSNDMNWVQWAHCISAQPLELHEQLISGPPLSELIHLFRLATNNIEQVMNRHRDSVAMALSVNNTNQAAIAGIRASFTTCMNLFAELNHALSDLNIRISNVEASAESNNFLLLAVTDQVRPQETAFSEEIFAEIPDIADIDHQ